MVNIYVILNKETHDGKLMRTTQNCHWKT